MRTIKPNIYYFYYKGELLTAVDAYSQEIAVIKFKKQELGKFDHITWYSGTFGGYHETAGDIALNNVN